MKQEHTPSFLKQQPHTFLKQELYPKQEPYPKQELYPKQEACLKQELYDSMDSEGESDHSSSEASLVSCFITLFTIYKDPSTVVELITT